MDRFDVVLLADSNPQGLALSLLSSHSTLPAAAASAKKHIGIQARAGARFQTVAIRVFEVDEHGDESLLGCVMPPQEPK